MVEQELADTNESLSDSTCTNQSIQGAKMKLESEMQTLDALTDALVEGATKQSAHGALNVTLVVDAALDEEHAEEGAGRDGACEDDDVQSESD